VRKGARIAACAATISGCGAPVVAFEGEHVVVLADPGFELCGGSLAHMDGFVARMAALLQQAPPVADERVEFRWFSDAALLPCGASQFGCERGGVVFSTQVPHNHELVHALVKDYGRAPPVFAEGLAVAHEGLDARADGLPALTLGQSAGVRVALAADAAELDELTAAGFVSMLVAQHGMQKFLRVYSDLRRASTAADVDEALRARLGTGLADSIAAFEALPLDCTQAQIDAKLMECEAPALEWDGARLAVFRELDCAQEDAVGPYDGERLQVLRTLTVDEAGMFELHAIADRPNSGAVFNAVVLTPCGSCGSGAPVTVFPGEHARTPLAEGRYSVQLMGPATATTNIGFLLERVDPSEPAMP
jgi:hypothetical protein